MQTKLQNVSRFRTARSGFTLTEAVVAMAVVGIMVLSLYGGITSGFFTVRVARENLRATQIMVEKMEVIRLCTWDQINSNGFIPTDFTAPYYPDTTAITSSSTNSVITTTVGRAEGLTYTGKITISPVASAAINGTYTGDLRQVTVDLSWVTQGLPRSRRISTYVSRYGIQNYLFN